MVAEVWESCEAGWVNKKFGLRYSLGACHDGELMWKDAEVV
jgi:hypothetical protein